MNDTRHGEGCRLTPVSFDTPDTGVSFGGVVCHSLFTRGDTTTPDTPHLGRGDVRHRAGQKYTCILVSPHVRRDGGKTFLATWESECAECGALFAFQTTAYGPPENRRCEKHRRPGRKLLAVQAAKDTFPGAVVIRDGPQPRRPLEDDISDVGVELEETWA